MLIERPSRGSSFADQIQIHVWYHQEKLRKWLPRLGKRGAWATLATPLIAACGTQTLELSPQPSAVVAPETAIKPEIIITPNPIKPDRPPELPILFEGELPFFGEGRLNAAGHKPDPSDPARPTLSAVDLGPSTVISCGSNQLRNFTIAPSVSGVVSSVSDHGLSINHTVATTHYFHLKEIKVKKDQVVSLNTPLGFVDCEGGLMTIKGPHLHFNVTIGSQDIPLDQVELGGVRFQTTSESQGYAYTEGFKVVADARDCREVVCQDGLDNHLQGQAQPQNVFGAPAPSKTEIIQEVKVEAAKVNTPTPGNSAVQRAIQETVTALEIKRGVEATMEARQRQLVPTPTLPKPTLTPISSTPTPVPTKVMSPTNTPTSSLDTEAAEYVLRRWMGLFETTQGREGVPIPGLNIEPHYTKITPTDIGRINSRPFTASEIVRRLVPSESNFLKITWVNEDMTSYTNVGPIWLKLYGEAELKNLRTSIKRRDNLSEADLQNGIQWRGLTRINFLIRHRARVRISRQSEGITPPSGRFTDWSDREIEGDAQKVKDEWKRVDPPPVWPIAGLYPVKETWNALGGYPSNYPMGGQGVNYP